MASTRISERPPPLIDPRRATLAFGRGALPRLARELCAEDRCIQQAALFSLCDLLHDPERVYETLRCGCMERLKMLLRDDDDLIRTKTTEALYLLASHSVGREALLKWNVPGSLAELLDEPLDTCRKNLHQTLMILAQFLAGVLHMMSIGLIPRLVRKVPVELVEIRELVISTLTSCMRVNPTPALNSNAVSILKEQLRHTSTLIRRAATSAMMAISVPKEGKLRVCEGGVLPDLVALLSDDDADVRANAAGVIMYTAVITQGKFQALEANAIPPLLCLVQSKDVTSSANALRAITCLAEAPSGRAKLLECVPKLETCLGHPASILQRAAATAIQVISWKP